MRLRVDRMSEGDYLVRGTLDKHEALAAMVNDLDESYDEQRLIGVTPDTADQWEWSIPLVGPVVELADWLQAKLSSARPGYYRKVHCLPGSELAEAGWGWQLGYCKGPGPGAFRGVYFQ